MKMRRRVSLEEARASANAAVAGISMPAIPMRRRSMPNKLESAQGMALIQWADMQARVRPELAQLRHIPNGGARDARTGGQLKAEGVRSGTWDYVLPVVVREAAMLEGDERPRILWPGLWIELKVEIYRNRKAGGLSDAQVEFGQFIHAQGYATVVAYSWTEAKDAIEGYLAGGAIPFFWCPEVSHAPR